MRHLSRHALERQGDVDDISTALCVGWVQEMGSRVGLRPRFGSRE
ncbi:hypothetical protein [Sphingobium sp. Ant17]|nr:hypothetical protein [Sphingobium sp. Ant17]